MGKNKLFLRSLLVISHLPCLAFLLGMHETNTFITTWKVEEEQTIISQNLDFLKVIDIFTIYSKAF